MKGIAKFMERFGAKRGVIVTKETLERKKSMWGERSARYC
jgi:hypothetical protein